MVYDKWFTIRVFTVKNIDEKLRYINSLKRIELQI